MASLGKRLWPDVYIKDKIMARDTGARPRT